MVPLGSGQSKGILFKSNLYNTVDNETLLLNLHLQFMFWKLIKVVQALDG